MLKVEPADIEKATKALQLLSDVMEPANISRITRAGYVAVEESLQFLKAFVDQIAEANNKEKVDG